MAKKQGMEQLLAEQLQDLYDAEKQLVKALPKMAKGARDQKLKDAFREHLEQTKEQVQRLEHVFQSLEMKAKGRPCGGMRGIVEECRDLLEEKMEPGILATGIAAAARKVEHYEIAGYENARVVARQLGMREAVGLLEETLREEVGADLRLNQICQRLLKEAPAAAAGEERKRGGAGSRRARPRRAPEIKSRTMRAPSGGQRGGPAHPLTDHEEIRRWAEPRGAVPACVRGTGGKGDIGMIRLDFPGYSGAESLEHVGWEDWFRKFDEHNLALMVQDKTASGETSNFNKLVSRESAEGRSKPKVRAAH
jgi:ferritin-like metal-binding protein YciE